MSQPQISDLFGGTSLLDSSLNTLTIDLSTYLAVGLDNGGSSSAVAIYAAIISYAHLWISQNIDEEVNIASILSASAPTTRNSQERTLYTYAIELYGNYNAPTLDPDEL